MTLVCHIIRLPNVHGLESENEFEEKVELHPNVALDLRLGDLINHP